MNVNKSSNIFSVDRVGDIGGFIHLLSQNKFDGNQLKQRSYKMSLQKLMTNYAEYNAWANQQFIDWLSTQSNELLNKELPSSFSNISKTLSHILGAAEFWYSAIGETEYDARNTDDLKTDEVMRDLITHSNLFAELIRSFSEEDLTKKIKIVNEWFESDLPRYEYIMQVLNHGIYHRGQTVTIARNIGITEVPMTDYNFYNIVKGQTK